MDSQHRHELQQNELLEFLTNSRQFLARHGMNLVLVILLATAAVVSWNWLSQRDTRLLNQAYGELAGASDPAGKQALAVQYAGVPGFEGKALLEAADLHLSSALGTSAAAADQSLTEQQRIHYLEEAARNYQRVIEIDYSKLQVINARFGLAAVRETQRDFDAAAKQYELIQQEAAADWPIKVVQAKQKLESLDEIRKPVEFPEAPAVQTDLTLPTVPTAPAEVGPPLPNIPGLQLPLETKSEPADPADSAPAPQSDAPPQP